MAIAPETVDDFLKQVDWKAVRQDDHNWSTGFRGDNATFNFHIRTTDVWIYFALPFPVKVQPAARANFIEHVLRLNYQMSMAKFMLDNDDDVILTVELPNAALQVGEFEDALRAICVYADENYVELVRLATDPSAVSSLKPKPGPQRNEE
jgi:hypothetical protein